MIPANSVKHDAICEKTYQKNMKPVHIVMAGTRFCLN